MDELESGLVAAFIGGLVAGLPLCLFLDRAVFIFLADLRSAKHLILIGQRRFDRRMMASADVSMLSRYRRAM